jgi:hypothetical protein
MAINDRYDEQRNLAVQKYFQAQQLSQNTLNSNRCLEQQIQAVAQEQAVNREQREIERINNSARTLLLHRLQQWHQGDWLNQKDFIFCYVRENTVSVFFVLNDISDVLEDDVHLFPSDGLVSQLRLLRG